jgi:hypothetical protein
MSGKKRKNKKQKVQIFVIREGIRYEIDDLYWFEENSVHDFSDGSHFGVYIFEIFVDGVQVYSSN